MAQRRNGLWLFLFLDFLGNRDGTWSVCFPVFFGSKKRQILLDILKKKFVKGEITKEESEKMKKKT